VTADGDAVAEALVARATRWRVPGVPEGSSVAVDPAAPHHSALLARMRSRRPSSQMPPLGTAVRDEAAIEAITRWIATDLAGAGRHVRSARVER
jgi:mono/diheme cytochrome c family protein